MGIARARQMEGRRGYPNDIRDNKQRKVQSPNLELIKKGTIYLKATSVLPNASHGRLISSTDSNDCSTKQEAVKQAEVLGVALSKMERWITKSVQITHIERLTTGLYRKKPSCIA